jgi:hypothetical protein
MIPRQAISMWQINGKNDITIRTMKEEKVLPYSEFSSCNLGVPVIADKKITFTIKRYL